EGIAKHNGPVTGELPIALAEYTEMHDLELATYASAEAQVAAISDDIAYNNHDLDDGLRARLFTVEDICTLPIIRDCFAEVDTKYPNLDPLRRRHEALRRVFGVMVENVLITSRARLAAAGAQSAQDIRGLDAPVIQFSDGLFADLKQIREFLFENMYRHWTVRRMRRKAAQIVVDIFNIFMDDPAMMPPEWKNAAQGDKAHRARVIADYIAGMTDRFALQEHAKLTDPNLKS
ncbi:MAG: deoxyguanosinetriphosphate triphosphohydrolase, partial [Paracoccaceae bacterium]